jgi:hypothetical protein
MGALKQSVRVREIPGEPMRYYVESWGQPKEPHTVDLSMHDGHGSCSCRDFVTNVARNRKTHPGAWNFYGTPDAINPQRTQCRHIAAAQRKYLMTTLPAVARSLHPQQKPAS